MLEEAWNMSKPCLRRVAVGREHFKKGRGVCRSSIQVTPGPGLGDRVIWIMGDQSYGRAPREIPKSHEMAKITWTSIAPKINPPKFS